MLPTIVARQWQYFTLDHLKRPLRAFLTFLSYGTTYLYLVPEYSYEKMILWKNRVHFGFYKYFTNQTFTFINSKVVYVKKHLTYQVYHLKKTKFLLSLNVLCRGQTIKLAVGTMAEPLHTWLKGVFRNLSTQNAIRVYLKETDQENGPKPHAV